MKYLLPILCLFIFSCDSGGGDVLDCPSAVIDECGVCDGNGIIEPYCDCDGNEYDCDEVCGGDNIVVEPYCNCDGGTTYDECGECGGDGTSCDSEGCTDINASNYNENATIDDGSCTNGYYENYMILVDGAYDENQINPLGSTSPLGTLEYNHKGSFPHLFGFSNIEMLHTDTVANPLGFFYLDDLTQGEFNLILENNLSGQTYDLMTAWVPLIIENKINNYDIVVLDDNKYSITHSVSEGEFNLIFNINYEDDLPMENINISLQYVLDCNPGIFMWCSEGENQFINENRPTTSFEFSVCEGSEINIKIRLLDNVVIEEIEGLYSSGNYNFVFIPPSNLISAGIQIFKYSIEYLNRDNDDYPCGNYLSNNYPNPFN